MKYKGEEIKNMKKSIKALVLILIISTAFTSCTSDETPTPTPIDFREAAEGTFQRYKLPLQLTFVRDTSSAGNMVVLDYETGDTAAIMFIIMETMEGFTYGFENDLTVGRYSEVDDMHTLVEPDGIEQYFLRIN